VTPTTTPGTPDAGVTPAGDSGTVTGDGGGHGLAGRKLSGGCSVAGDGSAGVTRLLWVLLVLGLLVRRRST